MHLASQVIVPLGNFLSMMNDLNPSAHPNSPVAKILIIEDETNDLAHELLSPVTVLRLNLELLESGTVQHPTPEQYARDPPTGVGATGTAITTVN
jgi:signal transduction histidine kinase